MVFMGHIWSTSCFLNIQVHSNRILRHNLLHRTLSSTFPHDYVSNNKSSERTKIKYDKGTVYPTNAVAAVSAVLCRRVKETNVIEFLLVKRRKEPGKGKWSLPGGSIKVGEPTVTAAGRELQEETGLDLDEISLSQSPFMTTDAIYVDEETGKTKFHYVIAQVFGWTKNSSIHIEACDDAAAAGWFTMSLLDMMTSDDFAGNIHDVVGRANRLIDAGYFDDVVLQSFSEARIGEKLEC